MPDKKDEIKKGIKFHEIETNKFKTNLFAIKKRNCNKKCATCSHTKKRNYGIPNTRTN